MHDHIQNILAEIDNIQCPECGLRCEHNRKLKLLLESSLTSTYTAGETAGYDKGINDMKKEAWEDGYDAGLAAAEKCVPEKADEGDGWKILEMKDRCCPGDDVASGFNSCRNLTLEAINTLRK